MSGNMLQRIVRGTAVISLFTLAGKALGFFQKLVMARLFGTGMEADAYTVAFSSIVFTFCIIPHKLMAPFLPLFSERRNREGEIGAWAFASSVATLLAVSMAATAALAAWGAPWLVAAASDFRCPETGALAVRLVRIMLPSAIFASLFSLATLALHADKRFAPPALADFLNKTVLILALLALARPMGIAGAAIAVVAGSFSGLMLAAGALRRNLHMLRFSVDWTDPMLKELGRLVPPVLASILVAQIRTVLDYRFASQMGEGYASSLGYARALPDTLMLIVPFAVGIVIYPFMSDMASDKSPSRQTALFMASMKAMALIFVPVSILMIVLREPLIQLAFQRGRFNAFSVALTAQPLLYYSMGLTSLAMEIILMRFYFSLKDTATPAVVGIAGVVVHVGIVLMLRDAMLHNSIALATTVSKTLKVAALYLLVRNRLTLTDAGRFRFTAKLCGAAAAMLAAVLLVDSLATHLIPSSHGARPAFLSLAVRLAMVSCSGLVAFCAAAWLLKMEETRLVISALWRRMTCREAGPDNIRG